MYLNGSLKTITPNFNLSILTCKNKRRTAYVTFASATRIRVNTLSLWNPEMSTEIQNMGTSGPKIEHVNVSAKKPQETTTTNTKNTKSVTKQKHLIQEQNVGISGGLPKYTIFSVSLPDKRSCSYCKTFETLSAAVSPDVLTSHLFSSAQGSKETRAK